MGSWLIFQRHYTVKADALGSTGPRLRVVEPSKSVEAVTARSGRTAGQRKLVQPGAREKGAASPYQDPTQVSVAAKAKACREQPTLGNSAS